MEVPFNNLMIEFSYLVYCCLVPRLSLRGTSGQSHLAPRDA